MTPVFLAGSYSGPTTDGRHSINGHRHGNPHLALPKYICLHSWVHTGPKGVYRMLGMGNTISLIGNLGIANVVN